MKSDRARGLQNGAGQETGNGRRDMSEVESTAGTDKLAIINALNNTKVPPEQKNVRTQKETV